MKKKFKKLKKRVKQLEWTVRSLELRSGKRMVGDIPAREGSLIDFENLYPLADKFKDAVNNPLTKIWPEYYHRKTGFEDEVSINTLVRFKFDGKYYLYPVSFNGLSRSGESFSFTVSEAKKYIDNIIKRANFEGLVNYKNTILDPNQSDDIQGNSPLVPQQ